MSDFESAPENQSNLANVESSTASEEKPRTPDVGRRAWLLPGAAILVLLTGLAIFTAFSTRPSVEPVREAEESEVAMLEVNLTEDQWRERLTEDQFYVLRQAGTERPFTNEYHDNKASGTYTCAGCGNQLFSSETKYDSGTGWPSFYAPLAADAVRETMESSFFDTRTEVSCKRCGGHLGHVFTDGPHPTGLRYCMNSSAMQFVAENDSESQSSESGK